MIAPLPGSEAPNESVITQANSRTDEAIMQKLGYKQELYRGFNAFMNFSFCFTAVAVISSITVTFSYGLSTGGPVVMIWGWIIGSVFSNIVGLSMAEICSAYPSAGSVYHWTGLLANEKWAPFMSYICGWYNFLGNAAGDASFAFGFGQILAAMISLSSNGGTSLSTGYQVFIAIGIAAAWAIKNLMRVDHQGWFNNTAAIYQVLSTVVIVAVILAVSGQLSTASFVWTSYNNQTGMSSTFYVCLIGLLMTNFSFSGYEAGGHMAEETKNSSTAAPRGIYLTCFVTALTGFAYLLGLLYATDNNITGVTSGVSSFPVVNVFTQAFTTYTDGVATGYNQSGALALTALLLINLFFAGFSSLTVTTRIGFALARDGAFPGSKFLYSVKSKNKTPNRVIVLVFFLDALMCLFPLINPLAFSAVTSITTIGYQISYAFPILLRLTQAKKTFKPCDFNLRRLSVPFGWLSAAWLCVTSCFFVFPNQFDQNMDQNAQIFNYTCVVVGGTLIIALVYWFIVARRHFTGPKRSSEDKKAAPSDDSQEKKIILDTKVAPPENQNEKGENEKGENDKGENGEKEKDENVINVAKD